MINIPDQTSFFPEKGMKKKGGKRKKKEESLQLFLAKYMQMKYPNVIFQSDIASGMRLTIGQAIKAKHMRSGRGQPDLIIMEPCGKYHALCIELKNQVSDVYLKDGITISDAKSSDHVREQSEMLKRLCDKNYFAVFGFGRDHCMKIIDDYMSL